jgi:cobalamin biosynthesis protein CbiG
MPSNNDETKKAKADLAAAKAKAKALRPWYQKKRFTIPLGFFAIIILSNALMPSENTDGTSPQSDSAISRRAPKSRQT